MNDYDVIIAGGGPAGVAAAYTAGKCGARALLLEQSGRLGGMATLALVGPLLGEADSRIQREIISHLGGRVVDFQKMDIDLYELLTARNVTVLLHSTVIGVLKDAAGKVCGVRMQCAGNIHEFRSKAVIDATGDGALAFQVGVPYEMGREDDRLCQPVSIMFTVAGIAPGRRFCCGSEEEARVLHVGEKTWEELALAAQEQGFLPDTVSVVRLYSSRRDDENTVNATQVNYLDGTDAGDLTRGEITARKQVYAILEFLRRNLPGYENAFISNMPAALGVRETRRFKGMTRLNKADCLEGRTFADAIVRGASFPIDIHNPAGGGQAAAQDVFAHTGVAERVKPYSIPYGVMVPEQCDGLLVTGRCIDASHEALASCRVMGIAMALGAGAGAAAAYAAQHGCELREVPPTELHPILF